MVNQNLKPYLLDKYFMHLFSKVLSFISPYDVFEYILSIYPDGILLLFRPQYSVVNQGLIMHTCAWCIQLLAFNHFVLVIL